MSGETTTSNRIAGNIHRYLGNVIGRDRYEFYQNSVKLKIVDGSVVRIPDFMICEEKGDAVRYTTWPLLIIEVLSESTAKIDHVDKRREYSGESSLLYYLMIEQSKCLVEMQVRDGDKWRVEVYEKMEDVIKLPYFNAELPLAEVYRRVVF